MKKEKAVIKVGMLVAYDWELLKNSLPRIYEASDMVCLALDKNRISWSCNPFAFDSVAFYSWVKEIDRDNKITVYEDAFSLKELNARENCNRQRTMLAEFMGKGGWHVQVDADEYFLDFKSFVNELLKYSTDPSPSDTPVNICANFIPLFKKVDGGYLFIDFRNGKYERIPMASNSPSYIRARQNGHFNYNTAHFVIHETWARNEDELRYKLGNWGHSAEELKKKAYVEDYLETWRKLNASNYHELRDFHPASPSTWPALAFCKGENINEFIENLVAQNNFSVPAYKLWYLNNKNIARIRFYLDKLKRKVKR